MRINSFPLCEVNFSEAALARVGEVGNIIAGGSEAGSISNGINTSLDSSSDAGDSSWAQSSSAFDGVKSAALESGNVHTLLDRGGGSEGGEGSDEDGGELHDDRGELSEKLSCAELLS